MTIGVDKKVLEDLAIANWILFNEKVLDGWGHVSMRHPTDPSRFLLSRALAPVAVTPDDILEHGLDGEPIEADGPRAYMERHLHSQIYVARPDVNAIVHGHSPALVAMSITDIPLRAAYHMAGFLHHGVPVFEMQDVAGDGSDMLIVGHELAKGLADALGGATVALIRGHGSVVVGPHLESAVARSIYTEANAAIQLAACSVSRDVRYLSKAEGMASDATYDSAGQMTNSYGRPYQIWKSSAIAARNAKGN